MRRLISVILVVLLVITIIMVLRDSGLAEPILEECWVLCDPESYVTLREGPGKGKPEFGGMMCGGSMWTDGKQKNGFLHVTELPAEMDTGWISNRYIVYDRPEEVNRKHVIRAEGRVACRKWVGGKITGWIHDGDELTVWWMSPSWAVTSRGYVKSEFIGEEVVEVDLELPGVWEGV